MFALAGAFNDIRPENWCLSDDYLQYLRRSQDEAAWIPEPEYYIKLISRLRSSILFFFACDSEQVLTEINGCGVIHLFLPWRSLIITFTSTHIALSCNSFSTKSSSLCRHRIMWFHLFFFFFIFFNYFSTTSLLFFSAAITDFVILIAVIHISLQIAVILIITHPSIGLCMYMYVYVHACPWQKSDNCRKSQRGEKEGKSVEKYF